MEGACSIIPLVRETFGRGGLDRSRPDICRWPRSGCVGVCIPCSCAPRVSICMVAKGTCTGTRYVESLLMENANAVHVHFHNAIVIGLFAPTDKLLQEFHCLATLPERLPRSCFPSVA